MAKLIEAFEADSELSERLLRRATEEKSDQLAPLILAQAAFHRDHLHDFTVQDRPDASYGSWIENLSVLFPLLHNERIIVDLVDEVKNNEQFIAKYGVTPGQFSRLVRDGFIRVTVRDGIDPANSLDEVARHPLADADSFLGNLFQALPQEAVFIGPVLREGIFSALKGNATLKETYEALWPACQGWIGELTNATTEQKKHGWYRKALTRSGALPHFRAIAYRLAYHACYIEARTDDGFAGAAAMIGREATGRLLSGTLAADGEARLRQIAEGIHYASLFHHRDTAPLTGAWGGQYAVRAEEHADMRDYLISGSEREVLDAEFDEVIAEIVARDLGDVTEKNGFAFRLDRMGTLAGKTFPAFLHFLHHQKETGSITAIARLRAAVYDVADGTELARTAENCRTIIAASVAKRHELLVKFAEEQTIFAAAGAVAGAALVPGGCIAKLGAGYLGWLISSKKRETCHLLAGALGFKQAQRDIYGAMQEIQAAKL